MCSKPDGAAQRSLDVKSKKLNSKISAVIKNKLLAAALPADFYTNLKILTFMRSNCLRRAIRR